jgi:methylated-DNA-protein-cysteine methyltransferase related protein
VTTIPKTGNYSKKFWGLIRSKSNLDDFNFMNGSPSHNAERTPFQSRTYRQIYAIVRQIPYGQIATYGQVAALADLAGQARLVGYALYRVDGHLEIPWHRVINAKGEISTSPWREGSDDLQRSLLEAEGVRFNAAGQINLRDYRWCPTLDSLQSED